MENNIIDKPKISVIVSVYNGEEYIERCIGSIINQTFKSIEIIIIDDGSTDNTPSICNYLKTKDRRIKVIHKPNGGLSHSRNLGIDTSKGEYVGFVDADDWILHQMYEDLYKLAYKYDADIVSGRYLPTNQDNPNFKQLNCHIEILSGANKAKRYLELGIKDRSNLYSACTKLYRRNIFKETMFPLNQRFEDMTTNLKLIDKANKFVVYNKYTYFYYMNSASITRNYVKYADLDLIKTCDEIRNLTDGTPNEKLGEIVYDRSYFSLLLRCTVYGVDNSVEDAEEFVNRIYIKYRSVFPELIKSEMPWNRKVIMPVLLLSPKITSKCLIMLRKAFRGNKK